MGELILGRHSYSYATRRGTDNNIIIGNFCSIAENTVFDGGFNHNPNFVSTFPFKSKMPGCDHVPSNVKVKGDINVGSDVWIGEGVVIMSGVTIGDGAIIGAKSVVTKDIQPYSVCAGCPTEVKRFRFDEEEIEMLLKLKWWDLPDEEIVKIAPLLMSENVEELLKRYGYPR